MFWRSNQLLLQGTWQKPEEPQQIPSSIDRRIKHRAAALVLPVDSPARWIAQCFSRCRFSMHERVRSGRLQSGKSAGTSHGAAAEIPSRGLYAQVCAMPRSPLAWV